MTIHVLLCLRVIIIDVTSIRKHDIVTAKPLYLAKWKGLISMPTFTKFVASARGLSGASDYMLEVCFNWMCFNCLLYVYDVQLLPDILNVEGRIGFAQVWEYLAKLQISSSRVSIDTEYWC